MVRAAALLIAFLAFSQAVAAQSAFDKLFPSLDLPQPFAALVADIRKGGNETQVGFVPLGRSLQRYAADPHYFASPRIIVAVTNGPLRDRLFLGYQPAARSIEIISFDEAEGVFNFQEVKDYGGQGKPTLPAVADETCAGCHQSRAPIFAAAPWAETNANPKVVAALPKTVQGLDVRQDFDGIDQFARSVERANRLTAAVKLWNAGDDMAKNFPRGLSIADPKLPDRDPLTLMEQGMPSAKLLEPEGAFSAETPRPRMEIWSPNSLRAVEDARQLFRETGIK
jgi:hypothetical protein